MNNARSRTKRLDGIIMGEDEVRKMWMRKEEELRRKKAGRRLDELEVSGIDAFPRHSFSSQFREREGIHHKCLLPPPLWPSLLPLYSVRTTGKFR